MSWLTDIAGKAENFLNAVDKSTANALTNVNSSIKTSIRKQSLNNNGQKDDQNILDAEYIDTPEVMSLRTSTSTNSLLSDNGNGMNRKDYYGHQRTSSYDSNGSSSKLNDSQNNNENNDRLMDYLNNKEDDIPEEEWQSMNDSNSNQSSSSSNNNNNQLKQAKRDLKELEQLNRKILELTSECKKLKLKSQNLYNQNLSNEKLIKELQSKEIDLKESLNVKESKILAMQIQMEQMMQESQEKDEKFKELQKSYNELQEQLKNQSNDNEMVVNLQKELNTLRQALEMEKFESKRIKDNCNQQLIRLEDNQRSLLNEMDSYRQKLNDKINELNELQLINSNLQRKYETIEQEYEQFKLKNLKSIQDSKDDSIQSSSDHSTFENNENEQLQIKILQEQNSTLINDLNELQSRYEAMNLQLEKYENELIPKQKSELMALNEKLQNQMANEMKMKNDIEKLLIEQRTYQNNYEQLKLTLTKRLNERDEEIDKLRKQLIMKQHNQMQQHQSNDDELMINNTSSNNSDENLSEKLKSLTDNLLSKQSTIEKLSSMNHSLKFQLEKSEKRLQELISNNNQLNNDVAIGIYHSPTFTNLIKHRLNGSSDNSQYQSLIEDDPNDGQVTRKVKRAYTAIDTFSIRLGNFLRLYPSARAAFLVYIVILHVWVVFVLMYYEPEIHSGNTTSDV